MQQNSEHAPSAANSLSSPSTLLRSNTMSPRAEVSSQKSQPESRSDLSRAASSPIHSPRLSAQKSTFLFSFIMFPIHFMLGPAKRLDPNLGLAALSAPHADPPPPLKIPRHAIEILGGLKKMQVKGFLVDSEIAAHERSVPCHRFVLGARCRELHQSPDFLKDASAEAVSVRFLSIFDI